MTSLVDAIVAAEPEPILPIQYRQHAEWDDKGGTAATGPVRRMVSDYAEMLTLAGLDPIKFRIVGKVSQWTKTHPGKDDTYSFFFQFETITADEDSPFAAELARLIRPRKPSSL